MKKRELHPQSLFDEPELLKFMEENDINPVHAHRLWQHFIRNPSSTNIRDCPDIPKRAYELLERNFVVHTTSLVSSSYSLDKNTIKLLIRLQDGSLIETVIMKYGDDGKPRNTVCLSSQIGCRMGCTFCATGTMGLIGHLTAGEIVEQLLHANRIEPIRNVVFMGMVRISMRFEY
jgi:adenine C2-methylase RlmN of 23S rRNA A2503 and tRNA A37